MSVHDEELSIKPLLLAIGAAFLLAIIGVLTQL